MSAQGMRAAVLAALVVLVVAGCTRAPSPPPTPSTPIVTPSSSPTAPTNEYGVLTEEAVQRVAPGWTRGQFTATYQALSGHTGDPACNASAWTTLYFLETLGPKSSNFHGGGLVAMTIAIGELSGTERSKVLDAFATQLSACVDANRKGSAQHAAPKIAGWSGLHDVAGDYDTYWAPARNGIVVVQLEPGVKTSGEVDAIGEIMKLQLGEAT